METDAGSPRTLRDAILYHLTSANNIAAKVDAIMAELPDPRIGMGGNMPPEPLEAEETQEERLLGIDPENLMKILPDELPALFDLHYPSLKQRSIELAQACAQWQADHKTAAGGWIDVANDAENGALADLIRQLDDFGKEVDETRRRVKEKVYLGGQRIDGWFNAGLREPVMEIRGEAKTISGKRYPPAIGTMQWAQTKYLTDKATRERQAMEAAAKSAQEEARRKVEEARAIAAAEASRIESLQDEGIDAEEAREIAAAETDQASAQADASLQSSALVGAAASDTSNALVRQHTATGTTIGLKGRWTFEVTDVQKLCLAIGAPLLLQETMVNDVAIASMIGPAATRAMLQALAKLLAPYGMVPASFVTTDDKQVRAAITARTMPLRDCPGLNIHQEVSASRRGG